MPVISNSSVRLKSGDAAILEKAVEAVVLFDYSEAEIENNDVSLEDYIEQKGYKFENKWERAQAMALKDFIKKFNKKSPGITLTSDTTGAKKLVFHIQVDAINLGNTAKSLLPFGAKTDGGVILNGKIYIRDKAGTNLCILSFSDIKGIGSSAIESRLILAYQALRSALIKFTRKGAKAIDDNDSEDDEDEEAEEEKANTKPHKKVTKYSEDDCVD
jgi:hypothetical protein